MGTKYGEARRNDPEQVDALMALPESSRRWAPPASEWSLALEYQAQLVDALGVVATLIGDLPAGVKRRSRPPAPVARPVTEVDRARARAEAAVESELDELIAAAHATYESEQRGG